MVLRWVHLVYMASISLILLSFPRRFYRLFGKHAKLPGTYADETCFKYKCPKKKKKLCRLLMWSLLINAGESAWPYILTTNLEQEDICKTVPFKVAHYRLIGLGD